jgi:hypothetical protein
MKYSMSRLQLTWICLSICVIASGCSKATAPMNENVQGTIKVNGAPVPEVVVQFVPDAMPGLLSGTGITDSKGHFEIQTADQPGAVIGKHKVIILVGRGGGRPNDPQAAQPDPANPAPAAGKGAPRIPPGFSDLQKPLLSVEVTADRHTDYDFDLAKAR